MTDKEKLQKLFDAALKAPAPVAGGPPQRAFPVVSPPPASSETVQSHVAPANGQTRSAPAEISVQDPKPSVLDAAASTELGALLDDQIRRQSHKRRRDAMVTALVLFGITGGGFAWFVQSPERVQAFSEAMRDIRSVGDVKSLAAKYQDALNRISARGQQLDQATATMGVDASAEDHKDPYMEAEMSEMMGGEGKNTGQRNRQLQQGFGNMEKKHGTLLPASATLKEEDSFDSEN